MPGIRTKNFTAGYSNPIKQPQKITAIIKIKGVIVNKMYLRLYIATTFPDTLKQRVLIWMKRNFRIRPLHIFNSRDHIGGNLIDNLVRHS